MSTVSTLHRIKDWISFARFTRALPVGTRPEPTNLFGLAIDHVRLKAGQVLTQKVLRGKRIFPVDHDPLLAEVRIESETRVDAVRVDATPAEAAPAAGVTAVLEAAVTPSR